MDSDGFRTPKKRSTGKSAYNNRRAGSGSYSNAASNTGDGRNQSRGQGGQGTGRGKATPNNNILTRMEEVDIRANYFKIKLNAVKKIYMYNISASVVVADIGAEARCPSRRVKRQILINFLSRQVLPNIPCATDYDDELITIEPLGEKYVNTSMQFAFADEDGVPRKQAQVTLKFQVELDVANLTSYLANPTSATLDETTRDHFLTALNIVFSHRPNHYTRRNIAESLDPEISNQSLSKFFMVSPAATGATTGLDIVGNLGEGLEARTGFFKGVRIVKNTHALLNINRVASSFYKAGNLANLIENFAAGSFGRRKTDVEIDAFISRLRVKTTYFKQSKAYKASDKPPDERVFTIDGLASVEFSPVPANVRFSWKHEKGGSVVTEPVTVEHYFQQYHGISLNKNKLVVRCGGPRGKQYDGGKPKDSEKENTANVNFIPAEYCEVLSGQSYSRLLSSEQTKSMINFANKSPADNIREIQGRGMHVLGIEDLQVGPKIMKMDLVSTEMLELKGKILLPPIIKYRNGATVGRHITGRGSWSLQQNTTLAISPGSDIVWSILALSNRARSIANGDYEWFFETFEAQMRTLGIRNRPLEEYNHFHLRDTGGNAAQERTQEEELAKLLGNYKSKGVGLLFVFLLSTSADDYSLIKRTADVVVGLPTICMVMDRQRAFRDQEAYFGPKSDPMTLVNYMLKVNVKYGGTNHLLDESASKLIPPNTMFMGIDVAHPNAGSMKGAPSIAAVVATIDSCYSQWPASIRLQQRDRKKSTEIVQDLKQMVIERLNHWKKFNKNVTLPENIIIYRDGVSERQFLQVRNEELPQIQAAIDAIYSNTTSRPRILLLCVVKRHETRFYPGKNMANQFLSGKYLNVVPGLVVSSGVTYGDAEKRDWFLQSHAAIQGTAVPAHYVVLHWDSGMKSADEKVMGIEEVQQMTHYMCFTFQRATKSISIHPAAYHADLVCDRVEVWLRKLYHPHPLAAAAKRENSGRGGSKGKGGDRREREREGEYDEREWRGFARVHEGLEGSTFYI